MTDFRTNTKKPKGKTGLNRLWHAFIYSLNGLYYSITKETAFQQEFCVYIVLLVVLFFLPLSIVFKSLLLLVNTLVLIVEMLNSAIEAIVDMVSPEYHALAKKAKDLGSGAVFVSIVLAVTLWISSICFIFNANGA